MKAMKKCNEMIGKNGRRLSFVAGGGVWNYDIMYHGSLAI
jgi:hypothetical protein